MTKPDRFARMVRAEERFNGRSDEYYAEQLLRREHAAVVRGVQNIMEEMGDPDDPDWSDGALQACMRILAMLEGRKQ
jgi:hypothetical protein